MRHASLFLVLLLGLVGCQSPNRVDYMSDVAFMGPAAANSPEQPVAVNGRACLDTDGNPGLCSSRIVAGQELVLSLPGRPYPYQLVLACSAALKADAEYSVPAGEPFTVALKTAGLPADLKSFICMGELHPQDRPEEVSARFEVRAKLVEKAYEQAEIPRLRRDGDDWYVDTGKYAFHVHVLDQGVWTYHRKASSVRVSGPQVLVEVETETCRRAVLRPGN
jgi:hypothetical protein